MKTAWLRSQHPDWPEEMARPEKGQFHVIHLGAGFKADSTQPAGMN
jgi:hypothetical protein